jgi:ABC-type antimicrobial peptide transport system permease subunit
MDIKEGRLPRPRSNEIVLSESVAQNRGLQIGDRIGTPVYERGEFDQLESDDIPVEMLVVGILRYDSGQALQQRSRQARPTNVGQTLSSNDIWLGLASYEYLESHERVSPRSTSLFIVPTGGHKDVLDAWLQKNVSSAQTDVITYDVEYREHQQIVSGLIVAFAVVGSITAIVAAIAMATLNYIFFTQRREEFGILHAVGRSRLWLVLRTVKETGSMIARAWLIGAALCGLGLLCFQGLVYMPKGLSLNPFNPTPWLLTFPVPLAVVATSACTIGWMLSKFDAVAVIERRS